MFVFPQRAAASLHVADTTDAVDDGLVVPEGRLLVVAELGMLLAGRFTLDGMLVAYRDGCRGVVVGHLSVLYKHAGHAVCRRGHDIRVVETDIRQSGRQRSIPVLLAGLVSQSQVPFAEGSRSITGVVEEVGHGVLFRSDDHAGISTCDVGSLASPRVLTREQRVA